LGKTAIYSRPIKDSCHSQSSAAPVASVQPSFGWKLGSGCDRDAVDKIAVRRIALRLN
jgi:hypothetical protein